MKIIAAMLVAFCLFACSSGESDESRQREDTVGKEIADDYNRAMQKAQDVEIELQYQKQKVEEALREADSASQDP